MQAHASAAIVNFSENCDQDLLPPYLDTLISKLLILLQNGQRIVQVRARTRLPSPVYCFRTSHPPGEGRKGCGWGPGAQNSHEWTPNANKTLRP